VNVITNIPPYVKEKKLTKYTLIEIFEVLNTHANIKNINIKERLDKSLNQ